MAGISLCISFTSKMQQSLRDTQNGYFPSSSGDCGKYVICQDGKALPMTCPAGLGFNFKTSSCDWPANIPQCNPIASLAFAVHKFYRKAQKTIMFLFVVILLDELQLVHGKSCKSYIACQRGSPRLLSCDEGLAFDEESQSCIDSDGVANCSN
ncbi:unnamed protein product [Leptidea sinapis]|uniref:Chitin-binding type-2 domain-containing protein n=1 Tax=Leptidea sinapis TaxID=189913 RepID=A0A5E4PWC0_9NEOP|nr:unnamed protein product [Leptidea sinapis]